MNREEILAKSRKENHAKLDERDQSIQTKANSISQGVGLVLCIVLGELAHAVTHDSLFSCLTIALYMGMYAAERISCAVMGKSRGLWVFAGIATFIAIVSIAVFLLKLFGVV